MTKVIYRAAVDRLDAAGAHSLTGTWPGEGTGAEAGKKGKKA